MNGPASDAARSVMPFEFLKGSPDQDVTTFQEYLAQQQETPLHPSLQDDVPNDEDNE